MEYTTGQIRPFEVYKEAWALIETEFVILCVMVDLGLIMSSTVILMGPIMIGLFIALIEKVDGRPANLGNLFKGFSRFKAGIVVAAIAMAPVMVFLCLAVVTYIPTVLASLGGKLVGPDQHLSMILGILAVEVVLGIAMTILHSLIIFSFPLIADKNLGGFAALKLSAKAAWANRGGVAGVFGIGILVMLAGYALFCVGIYLALPVIMVASTVAYRKVFPRSEQPLNFAPPPPDAYQGL